MRDHPILESMKFDQGCLIKRFHMSVLLMISRVTQKCLISWMLQTFICIWITISGGANITQSCGQSGIFAIRCGIKIFPPMRLSLVISLLNLWICRLEVSDKGPRIKRATCQQKLYCLSKVWNSLDVILDFDQYFDKEGNTLSNNHIDSLIESEVQHG